MVKRGLFFTILVGMLPVAALASNSGITYQGRILKPDGAPLTGAAVQFKMQIRTPDSNNCLMYEELQTLDLRNTSGQFSLTINDGSGARTDSTGFGLDRIFANRGSFAFNPTTCSSGSTYAPNEGDGRNLVVLFKDETMASWEPVPAQKINFVPFAFETKQVQGFGADSLLRVVNAGGDPLTGVSPLSNAQYTALLDLLNGSSAAYTKAGQLNGVALPTMTSGEVLGWNGSAWVSQAATSGPNSITTTMIQNGAVDGTKLDPAISISTSGEIGAAITTTRDFRIYAAAPSTFYVGMLADPALAASYTLTWPLGQGTNGQVLTTDGSGKLTWTTPSSAGITDLSGDVTATGPGPAAATVALVGGSTAAQVHQSQLDTAAATAANTASTIVKRDGSGGFAAGAVSTTSVAATGAVTQGSAVFNDSQLPTPNTVTVQAPANVTSSYTLKWPTSVGGSGTVLSTDGSGALSWIAPGGGGTVTSVTSANLDIGVANPATAPVLTLNTGTGADQILKLDSLGKIPSVDGSQITNLSASGVGSGVLPVSHGGTGVSGFSPFSVVGTNVDGTQQIAVSSSKSGSMLQWDVAGPAFSAAVWPSSTTANKLLYSSANDVVGQLDTASNGVLVTDGFGVPLIGSALPLAVQSNIASVGTITSGTWNGSAIAAGYGGTGQTSYAVGDLLYADTMGSLAKLPASTSGYVLTSNGVGAAPSWQAAAATGVTGSGTVNRLPKFTGTGVSLGDSVIYESSGKIGIGTTSPTAVLEVAHQLKIASEFTWPTLTLQGTDISYAPSITFKHGGGTLASPTAATSGTSMGSIYFSDPQYAGGSSTIEVEATENHAAGALGSNLKFATTANGSSSRLTRMTIDSSGNVGIGMTAPFTKLEVAGSLRVGDGGETCDASLTGAIRYNGGNLQFCAGSMPWTTLGAAGAGISSLTGDVTGSGPGATATTVVSVGTSSAANIHSAELLANAATDANTASAIVKRDGSGGFSAGAITQSSAIFKSAGANTVTVQAPASVTSSYVLAWPTSAGGSDQVLKTDASGQLSWTSLPTALPPNGAAGGDLSGTYPDPTVATVGGSTAANINSAELLANAATAVNTSNAIVKRDGTGNFTANVGTFNGVNIANGVTGINLTSLPGANYSIALPMTDGLANQVLSTDGAGSLSWVSALTSTTGFVQGGNTFGTNADLGTNDAYDLNLRTGGTTKMTVTSGGNVGIGTTSPSKTLNIVGSGILTQGTSGGVLHALKIENTSSALADRGVDLVFGAGSSDAGAITTASTDGTGASSYMSFATRTSAAVTEKMRIDNNGNVGIGTTSPGANLDVVTGVNPMIRAKVQSGGSPYASFLIAENEVVNHKAILSMFSPTASSSGPIQPDGAWLDANGAGGLSISSFNSSAPIRIFTGGYADANEHMRITSAGNVGIGTTAPLTKLEVAGSLRVGDGGETCDTSLTGAIRYNGGNLQFCAGSMPWTTLGVAGSGISSLTGDVTATGPGAAAAAVAFVGGSAAADIHQSQLDTAAATSANAPSTLVKRDGSGNFSAGAISATSVTSTGAVTAGSVVYKDSTSNTVTILAPTTVTSSYVLKWPTSAGGSDDVLKTDASGQLSWTSLPTALPPNGAAGGDLSGTYPDPTIATVGGSTAANINSAELLANAATAANTSNAIVKRDATGNFAANIATVNGLALNNAGSVLNVVNPIGAAYTLTLPVSGGTNGYALTTDGTGKTSWSPVATSATGFMNGGNSFGANADLGTNDGFDLNFRTGGTTQMTVTSGGNVGIGTTAPTQPLDLVGQMIAADSRADATIKKFHLLIPSYLTSSPDMAVFSALAKSMTREVQIGAPHTSGSINGPSRIGFFTQTTFGAPTSNTERMTIDSSGNVGIGTTNPSKTLGVVGSGIISQGTSGGIYHALKIENTSGAASDRGVDLTFGAGSSDAGAITAASNDGTGTNAYMSFATRTSAAVTEKMRIDSSGNVGIGTTEPWGDLDVSNGTVRTGVLNSASSGSIGTLSTHNLNLMTDSADVMTLTTTGNVGIGTTSPGYRLEVAGTLRTGNAVIGGTGGMSPALKLLNTAALSADQGNSIIFQNGPTVNMAQIKGAQTGASNTDGYLTFDTRTAATVTEKMRIDNVGNVGIGTTVPSEKLEVVGNVKATSFISTSDRRLKKDIAPVSGLDAILRLNGVSWHWKTTNQSDMGVIAQEVERVFPRSVVTDPKTGFKAVKYNSLIAPLIESTKELYGMCKASDERFQGQDRAIASLTEENRKLKDEVTDLKRRLENIEKLLNSGK